ncbi:O-antigen polymerase [Vibrio cyclitrophicus]
MIYNIPFVLIGFFIEFAYSGVPILSAVNNISTNNEYTNFGIPTFHVFFTLYIHYLAIHAMLLFFVNKDKVYIIPFIAVFVFDLLILSRGMLIFIFLSIGFGYFLIRKPRFNPKYFIISIMIFSVISVGFSILGNIRSANDNTDFAKILFEPSESFDKTGLSSDIMWVYIYATSPLANLNETIIYNNDIQYELLDYVTQQYINEVIRKRIYADDLANHNYRVANYLTVGTVFFKAYNRAGYIGLYTYLFSIYFFIATILFLINRNLKFDLVAYSILTSLITLCIFDNMLINAFTLTLFFPLFLLWSKGKKKIFIE